MHESKPAMTQLSFEHLPIIENSDPLVDLKAYPFLLEPVYFNQGIAPHAQMQIRREVAERLAELQTKFNSTYRFKIWDGYRPRFVQDAIYNSFWQRIKAGHPDWNDSQCDNATEQFVTRATSQKRIPPHATGGAIDLTLVAHDGTEFDMGTVFDHFGPEAEPFYFKDKPQQATIHKNRMLLRDAMTGAGFTPDEDEWWHFDYGNQLWAVRAQKDTAFYGEVTG